MTELYGNTVWNNATPNSEKRIFSVPPEKVGDFVSAFEDGKFNYCYYQRNNAVIFAFDKEQEKLLTVNPLFDDVTLTISAKNTVPSPIIGNVSYKDISHRNRYFQTFQSKEMALRCADELQKNNIPFSGRIYSDRIIVTVSKQDSQRLNDLLQDIEQSKALFQEKRENISEIRTITDAYFSTFDREKILRKMEEVCYNQDIDYSRSLIYHLNDDFVRQYSYDDLAEFSRKFDEAFRDTAGKDVLLLQTEKIKAFQQFKKTMEKKYTLHSLTDKKGYSREQQHALKTLSDSNIPLSVLALIDYEFNRNAILKIRDLWKSSENNFLSVLAKHIAEVKHQPANEIDRLIQNGTYQAKQPFSEQAYRLEEYSFDSKLEMYKIPIKFNEGIINRLTNNHTEKSFTVKDDYSAFVLANNNDYCHLWISNGDDLVKVINLNDIFNDEETKIFSDMLSEMQALESEKSLFRNFAVDYCTNDSTIQDIHDKLFYADFSAKMEKILLDLTDTLIANAVIGKSVIPAMTPSQIKHFVSCYHNSTNLQQELFADISKQVHANLIYQKLNVTPAEIHTVDTVTEKNTEKEASMEQEEDFFAFEQRQLDKIKEKAKGHIRSNKAKIDLLEKENDDEKINEIYQSIVAVAEKYHVELSVVDDYRYFLENRYSNEEISNTLENEDVYTDEFSRNIDDIVDGEIFDEELSEEIPEKSVEETNTFPVETFVEQLPEETITAPTEASIEQPSEQAIPTEMPVEKPSEENSEEQIQRHFHSINDLKIGDKFLYQNKEYTVTTFDGIYPNDIGVSYTEKMSGGITYQLTSNINWRELVTNGKYIEPDEKSVTPENTETVSADKKPQNYSDMVGQNIVLDTQDGKETVVISGISSENNTATVLSNKDIFPTSYEIPLSEVIRYFYGQSIPDELQENTVHSPKKETSTKEKSDSATVPEKENTVKKNHTTSEKKTAVKKPMVKPTDFTITEDMGIGTKSERFNNNLNAIRMLQQLESENRQATSDEQKILARYVGWGGLSEYFKPTNPHYQELKSLLSENEYNSARGSTLDAFYTTPVVIENIYKLLEKAGFQGGNILEPSMGIGNFFGKMPNEMRENSHLYGVEIDSITGRIARQLYPNANISITGFEKTGFNSESFDVILGNVPFGDLSFNDNVYGTNKIHDYFFLHSLDKVKEGGIIAFVTSKGTMDKKNSDFRKKISQQAKLLGAVRLPNTAFKSTGTEVTIDIIFLQKTTQLPEKEPNWTTVGINEDGLPLNQYFIDNPQMVLGKIIEGNKMYAHGNNDTTCIPFDDEDLSDLLPKALENIHAEFTAENTEINPLSVRKNNDVKIPENLKNYDFFAYENNIYMFLNNAEICLNREWNSSYNKANIERAKLYIAIRDTVRELLTVQQDNSPDTEIQIKQLQQKLNQQYDTFYKKYGLIHSRLNHKLFHDDNSYPLMLSLEDDVDLKENKLLKKSDIFSKRTIRPHKIVESVDTPQEALILSVAEKGRIDLNFMATLTGMPIQEIIDDLVQKKEIFPVPELSTDEEIVYQTASEYLSGNIYEKLDIAKIVANSNSIYLDNVTALEEVLPTPLKAGEIDIQCGATWIPPEYYRQFMYETFQTPDDNRADRKHYRFWSKKLSIDVEYSPNTNKWNISNKSADRSLTVSKVYGTPKRSAYTIFEDVLNLHIPNVTKKVPDPSNPSKDITVKDLDATKLVQKKAEKIRQDFKKWIFKDPERRRILVDMYNRRFNGIRPREYDGSHMVFAGMSSSIELRSHQKDAIAHAIYGGNTLFAHTVGAGKSFEMIATAMEKKRLGLCNKTLFAVPNHLTEQIGADFMKLYPSANILVATKKDFQKQNRRKLLSKIATGNYDAVIIGHSQLGMIPLSPERQERLIHQQIQEITDGIRELKASQDGGFQVKQMEQTKKALQKKLESLTDTRKDDIVCFEELGIDNLIVDECHEFKNLMSATKLQNVAGISGRSSQKAMDLFMKCRYLDEKTGGRGIVFATGTPVSNSVTELHTMMKYLEYDMLCRQDMQNFDNFISVFGKQTTDYELKPTGNGFKVRTRISDYVNLPELMSMFKQCADVKTADMLNLPVPECEMHIVNVEATDLQKDMVAELSDRADEVSSGAIDPTEDNLLKITSDGRKTGLDPRLIDPLLEDNPNTKLNQCVRNVFEIYKNTEKDKLTQIIFCDLGVPKTNTQSNNAEQENEEQSSVSELEAIEECTTFCVYEDIRDKLIDLGVKPSEIAFIHHAKTEIQKSELFDKVRSGEVRVLLGSTAKMGTGTNVQDKLIALHDLDVPWRPADLEQRRGRMVRQGNQNKKVHLYRYVTKGTFDAYSYQLLEKKQQFISKIMTSKSTSRTCKDVDQEALTYAEIKALCTGDERIKEKLSLENRLQELRVFQKEYTDTKYEMEDKINLYPQKKEGLLSRIASIEKDFEQCRTIPIGEDGLPVFSIKLNGKTFTDYKESADELKVCCSRVSPARDNSIEIGEIYGFKINIHYSHIHNCVRAIVKGNQEYAVNFGMYPLANVKKLEQVLTLSIQKELDIARKQLDKLEKDMVSAKEIVQKPFEFEQEISEKEERLSELDAELTNEAMAKVNTSSKSSAEKKPYYFGKNNILSGKTSVPKVTMQEITKSDKSKPVSNDEIS